MKRDNKSLPPALVDSVPQEIFKAEVRSWAESISVSPQSISFQELDAQWAFCTSAGDLTFSLDLLRQPAAFRRKVIVHELLHLKYPHHGKLFRALEKAYLEQG